MMPNMNGPKTNGEILRCENLTLGYDRHPAIHHLDYGIRRGALVAVAGPNGAGKSTLLKGIMGTIAPLGGTIHLTGISRQDIAYLPQRSEFDSRFPISVFDMIAMGMWKKVGATGGLGTFGNHLVKEAIHAVKMRGFERRPIGTLSGGQMQRALFARLYLQNAPLILLDEPFNAIDSATVRDLMDLIRCWHEDGKTILAVLHDQEQIRATFPETLLLARERIASGPTSAVLTPENLRLAQSIAEAFDAAAPYCTKG